MNLSLGRIFLIDAIGAIGSTLFLLLVLPQFESFFGMPKEALFKLGAIALLLSLFSSICYFRRRTQGVSALLWIASGNIFYTLVSFFFMYLNWTSLTAFGVIYFFLEKITIYILVSFELRFFLKNQKSRLN